MKPLILERFKISYLLHRPKWYHIERNEVESLLLSFNKSGQLHDLCLQRWLTLHAELAEKDIEKGRSGDVTSSNLALLCELMFLLAHITESSENPIWATVLPVHYKCTHVSRVLFTSSSDLLLHLFFHQRRRSCIRKRNRSSYVRSPLPSDVIKTDVMLKLISCFNRYDSKYLRKFNTR